MCHWGVLLTLRMKNMWSLTFYLSRTQPSFSNCPIFLSWSIGPQGMNLQLLYFGEPIYLLPRDHSRINLKISSQSQNNLSMLFVPLQDGQLGPVTRRDKGSLRKMKFTILLRHGTQHRVTGKAPGQPDGRRQESGGCRAQSLDWGLTLGDTKTKQSKKLKSAVV